MTDRDPAEIAVYDRLGFQFVEYADDHDFRLGPGAAVFSNAVFAVTVSVVIAALVLGVVMPVSVKAPISGQIQPETVHKIYPRITGRITELRVKRGDVVAPGDTIAMLGAEGYEESLADLEFQKSQAEKRLAQLEQDFANRLDQVDFKIRQQELALGQVDASSDETRAQRERAVLVAEKQVTKARLALEEAEKQAAANETLFERGLIARNQVDDSRTQLELARNELAIRDKDLETARAAVATTRRQDRLGSARAEEELRRLRNERQSIESQRGIEVAGAEHEVANLVRRIEHGETEVGRQAVVSDAAGAVLEIPVNPGQTASSQVLIAEIADLDDLVLVAHVTEMHRKRLQIGHRAHIKIPTYKDYEFRGTVRRISPGAKLIQGRSLYEIRLDIEMPEKLPALRAGDEVRLLPGMTAAGNVLIDRMRAIKYIVVVKMLKRI